MVLWIFFLSFFPAIQKMEWKYRLCVLSQQFQVDEWPPPHPIPLSPCGPPSSVRLFIPNNIHYTALTLPWSLALRVHYTVSNVYTWGTSCCYVTPGSHSSAGTVLYCTLVYCIVYYCTVLYFIVMYTSLLYYTIQYNVLMEFLSIGRQWSLTMLE